MNNSSQVWAYGNLCCSIGATQISLIFTACARYFTRLTLNCCSTARALIGCSINCCTCPGIVSVTFASLSAHDESCLVCDSTMSRKSTKSSGVPTRESDILHHLVDFLTQFLSDFSVRLLSHSFLILGGIFPAIEIKII
jgi:hypothetical protein